MVTTGIRPYRNGGIRNDEE